MARRNNNTMLLIVLVILIIGFGVYCAWGKKFSADPSENFAHKKDQKKKKAVEIRRPPASEGQIELIPRGDGLGDDIEFVARPDNAFEIGFGIGPGLYGSGRNTSEMIGN